MHIPERLSRVSERHVVLGEHEVPLVMERQTCIRSQHMLPRGWA